mmetsp:Transcript_12334/g.32525  ORF Transcript_12334/g.32525 Transcript_12334/m.32525 type:complete len:336 (-) Transcript_12334:166-1173(-)
MPALLALTHTYIHIIHSAGSPQQQLSQSSCLQLLLGQYPPRNCNATQLTAQQRHLPLRPQSQPPFCTATCSIPLSSSLNPALCLLLFCGSLALPNTCFPVANTRACACFHPAIQISVRAAIHISVCAARVAQREQRMPQAQRVHWLAAGHFAHARGSTPGTATQLQARGAGGMGGGGGRGKGCMNGERLGFEVMLVVVVLVQGHWLWADRQALLLQLLQAAALLSCTLLHEPSLLQLQPQPLPLLASRKGMPGHPMAEHQRRQRVHYARFPYAHSKAHERAQEGQELLQQGSGQESACAVHRHKRKVALASTAAAAAAALLVRNSAQRQASRDEG